MVGSIGAVLFVDRDAALLELCRCVLERAGLEVLAADNAFDALELALTRPPDVAVIGSDLHMLGRVDVAAGLYAQHDGGLPLILLLDEGQQAPASAQRLGVYACLFKPFSVSDLVTAIMDGLRLPLAS